MDSIKLQTIWSRILRPSHGERRVCVIRFPPECIPQLFLGFDEAGCRCLLLKDKEKIEISVVQRENISLDYLRDGASNYIIIRLDNDFFADLFDDLIVSIYHQIEVQSSGHELSKEFISAFHKWSEFFDNRLMSNMSNNVLLGLMGELIYLGHLLDGATAGTVNEVLRSWRGPYDNRTDFVLPDKLVEVKTILKSKKDVRISSEFQLEKEPGLGIELTVVSVEKDILNGQSIKEKLAELKECVQGLCGDYLIVLKALKKVGLSNSNVGDYDNIRFTYISRITYDAALEGFPKLVKSVLPGSIKKVKYSLMLTELTEYIITEDQGFFREVSGE